MTQRRYAIEVTYTELAERLGLHPKSELLSIDDDPLRRTLKLNLAGDIGQPDALEGAHPYVLKISVCESAMRQFKDAMRTFENQLGSQTQRIHDKDGHGT